jgi:hypothetical protein
MVRTGHQSRAEAEVRGHTFAHGLDDVLAVGLFRFRIARERFDAATGSLRVQFLRIADNAARDVLRLGWQKARQLESDVDPDAIASELDRHRDFDTD